MHTIFGIAKSSAKLEALLSSLEANSIPLRDITVILPGEQDPLVPPEAARAEAVADDFSGNPRRAAVCGAIGALIGMGAMVVSVFPALIAIGAGPAFLGAAISAAAGGAMGALLGLGLGDSKIEHYQELLKSGSRLIAVKVPDTRTEDFVGLFEREGLQDVAVSNDNAVPSTR